jgi:peptide/nickel transport system substrate-binding protein
MSLSKRPLPMALPWSAAGYRRPMGEFMSAEMKAGATRRDLLKLTLAGGAAVLAVQAGMLNAAFAQAPAGQVVVGFSQEPTNFHPLMPSIEVDQGVHWNLFSPLWGVNEKGQFVPDLAAEMPSVANGGISEDGLVWRVKLREGVKWHDGTPFTAEDVKYSLELLKNSEFRASTRNGHELIEKIEVISPTEISWTMKSRSASYPAVLAWTFIVPKHVLSKQADVNAPDFAANPVGTGPFKWKSRTSGDEIVLEANADYHGEGPFIERLVFKYIPDLTVMYTQFQTGAIDYLGLQGIAPDRYQEATQLPDRTIHLAPQPAVETITLNLEHPPLKELAVRQALYYGMDKATLLEQIYYGIPQPSESYLPKDARAFNANLPAHEYNPDKARKLLDDAGWVVGSDGIRSKDGVALEFTLQATAGNHIREQLQQVLQQLWREIGVDMKIQTMPPAVLWADNWVMSKFQAIVAGTGFMLGPDADTTNYFASTSIAAQGGSGLNNFQYKNPEVDALLKQGQATSNEEERDAIYRKQQEIIRRDLPFLPFYHITYIEGTNSKLKGYVPNVNVSSNVWNARSWSWDK